MKPYVICHMNSSIDGRILGSRWRPAENLMSGLFERIHEELGDLVADRPCDRQRIRQGAGLPQPHGSDLSARTLVRTPWCESLRHRTRSTWWQRSSQNDQVQAASNLA
jgi:hypothetical protein